jgi:hypothetical protein
MNEYDKVIPTETEVAGWRRKHPRQGPPYRVQCNVCGGRFWLSGIGLGSHRRSYRHRDPETWLKGQAKVLTD